MLGKTTLPKTTYFKFADLWFAWFIANIFIILSVHIILENVEIPESFGPSKRSSNPIMIQPARRGDSGKRAQTKNKISDMPQTLGVASDGIQNGWLSMERINTFFKPVEKL